MAQRRGAGITIQRTGGAVALAALLVLAACATEPEDDGSGRPINFPQESEAIDLAETDLTLPLDSPLEISAVRERVSEGQVFENIYAFHDVKGFIRTSRVIFGHFSANTSRSLRHQGFFEAFADDLSAPRSAALDLGPAYRFQNGDRHTQGFYAFIGEDPYFDRCFVARIGYLLVDYASVPAADDSVDTIVEVFLCGELPPEEVLLAFLAQLKTVDDRDAYRHELSKRAIGTI
ncbi:hypothetical protein [Pelagibius marinus]|uniref:hypothetical protein n=1 Tax=Pelagibius marinus TaxID=2762760 RepID=UPI0018732B68|nr:hypothetical protein [Pelagibius marinus]